MEESDAEIAGIKQHDIYQMIKKKKKRRAQLAYT